MASKYQKRVGLPEEFPTLLKDFTREVLRAQPADVYRFGAKYFEDVAHQMQGVHSADAMAHGPGEEDEVSKVEGELLRRFQEDDVERNGYVPGTRVRNVLERTLHLSQPETLFLLSQCSIDSLGLVNYKEDAPRVVEALPYAGSQADVVPVLPYDKSQEEFESILLTELHDADEEGIGMLEVNQIRNILENSEIPFSDRNINVLLLESHVDEEGLINLADFVEQAFALSTIASQF